MISLYAHSSVHAFYKIYNLDCIIFHNVVQKASVTPFPVASLLLKVHEGIFFAMEVDY
jgi:hypothetical protein